MLTSRKYRREMRELTDARAIPITRLGAQVLVGFKMPEYEAALAKEL